MRNCCQPADIISMAHHLHVWLLSVYILLIVYMMYCFAFTLILSYRTLAFKEDNIFFVRNNAVVDGFTVFFSLQHATLLRFSKILIH